MTSKTLPAKGTVWKHATRKDWQGEPLLLTVTSITRGKVYSRSAIGLQTKTPVDSFDQFCLEIVSLPEPKPKESSPKFTPAQAQALFAKAHAAGMEAGEAARPTPMVVYQREHPLDDSSPIVKVYEPVMDGVCGFAWIKVRPANSSFGRWLKNEKGCRVAYQGGISIWVGEFGQSYERKMAYAYAFAKVLEEAGIKAYAEGRLD